MAQLETTLKSDLGEKKTLQDALVREREQYAKLEAEFQDLQAKYFTLKESSEGQEEKLRYFAGENSVEAKDLEEALLMLRDGDNIHTFFLPYLLHTTEWGVLSVARFSYVFSCELRGPAWAVGSYIISQSAGGTSQNIIFKTL